MRVLSGFLLAAIVFAGPLASVGQLPVTPPASRASGADPASKDLCPLTIFIDAQGRLYDSRFGGRYHVTDQTLRNDVGGGCKEQGSTSSVRIQPSRHTKVGRVQQVLEMVRSARPDIPVTMITPQGRH